MGAGAAAAARGRADCRPCPATRRSRLAYTVRLKFPANYAIPAHSHPTDENVVVVSGALTFGMGDKLAKRRARRTRRCRRAALR